MVTIKQRVEFNRRLYAMNPHMDPKREFENTFEGNRYYHMKENPELYVGCLSGSDPEAYLARVLSAAGL